MKNLHHDGDRDAAMRVENERLRTEVGLLTKIIQLEFVRRLPNRSEQMRKIHEVINSLRFGFHKRTNQETKYGPTPDGRGVTGPTGPMRCPAGPRLVLDEIRYRVGRLVLRPDDILVVRTEVLLDSEQVTWIRKRAAEQSGHPIAKIMVLNSCDIAVLRKEE